MLAYLFWHSPDPSADRGDYEALLLAFHARLREAPPPGFRESIALHAGGSYSYEDWYLVDDWAALGALNAAAIDAAHRDSHDPVARLAAAGAGGVYALRGGALPIGDAGAAQWSPEWPAGERDPAAFALWQRQMVLGPAPEFCLLTPGPGRGFRRLAPRQPN